MTALEAIISGAHLMAKEIYQATAREIKGIGIAVDSETFDRAYMMWVDSQKLAQLDAQDLAQRINAAGYFDVEVQGTPIRIACESVIDVTGIG